jgi:hypothetical protein
VELGAVTGLQEQSQLDPKNIPRQPPSKLEHGSDAQGGYQLLDLSLAAFSCRNWAAISHGGTQILDSMISSSALRFFLFFYQRKTKKNARPFSSLKKSSRETRNFTYEA